METRAAAAVWGADGRLTAWIPNQGRRAPRALAGLLGLDQAEVRIITPDVGGAFGAKFGADPEHAVICWVARRLGRPARWTETRNENLVGMTHGRAQIQKVTIGGSRDGTVAAYRSRSAGLRGLSRIGAFLPALTILMAPGPYAIPRAEAVATSVVTNTTPVGAYRGAGRPEATRRSSGPWTCSAAEAGLDPARSAARTCCPPSPSPHTTAFGALYDSGDYAVALDKALAAAGYQDLRAEQAKRRADGEASSSASACAATWRSPGPAASGQPQGERHRRGPPDGSATILTGTSPHGQGHQTVWAMLASEELGIPIDKITLKWGDTDLIPEGGGTGGSRSLQQGGAASSRPPATCSTWPGSGPPRARGQPADLVFDPRAARSRWPATRMPRSRWPAGGTRAAAGACGVHRARRHLPIRRARGRGRGGHRDRQGGAAPGGHRRRPGTVMNPLLPRASGTAASPRGWPRRCSRRSSTTPTATR